MANYTSLDPLNILAIMISLACLTFLYFFMVKSMERIKRIEKKLVEIIKGYHGMHDSLMTHKRRLNKKDSIEYMEGDIDLIAENKKATFRAVYFPKKIKKKQD